MRSARYFMVCAVFLLCTFLSSTALADAKIKCRQAARSDGEDIIAPLVEQAAQAIMDVAAKK